MEQKGKGRKKPGEQRKNTTKLFSALAFVTHWLEHWSPHQKGHGLDSWSRTHIWVTGLISGPSELMWRDASLSHPMSSHLSLCPSFPSTFTKNQWGKIPNYFYNIGKKHVPALANKPKEICDYLPCYYKLPRKTINLFVDLLSFLKFLSCIP